MSRYPTQSGKASPMTQKMTSHVIGRMIGELSDLQPRDAKLYSGHIPAMLGFLHSDFRVSNYLINAVISKAKVELIIASMVGEISSYTAYQIEYLLLR